jgi:hypothetical protein
VAIAFVVLHHGLASTVGLGHAFHHGDSNWPWPVAHGAFVLAIAAVCVVSWRLSKEVHADLVVAGRRRREAQVTSEVGAGSTFRVFLPSAEATVVPLAAPAASTRATVAASAPGFVLVVDDESAVREVVAEALRAAGLEVPPSRAARRRWSVSVPQRLRSASP